MCSPAPGMRGLKDSASFTLQPAAHAFGVMLCLQGYPNAHTSAP